MGCKSGVCCARPHFLLELVLIWWKFKRGDGQQINVHSLWCCIQVSFESSVGSQTRINHWNLSLKGLSFKYTHLLSSVTWSCCCWNNENCGLQKRAGWPLTWLPLVTSGWTTLCRTSACIWSWRTAMVSHMVHTKRQQIQQKHGVCIEEWFNAL